MNNLSRAGEKECKACTLAADKAPDNAENNKNEEGITGPGMPIEMVELRRPPRKPDYNDKQPMTNPRGNIPQRVIFTRH